MYDDMDKRRWDNAQTYRDLNTFCDAVCRRFRLESLGLWDCTATDAAIMADNARWVLCAVVAGSNEGWYLHVRRLHQGNPNDTAPSIALGKGFDFANVMAACTALTLWFHDPCRNTSDLLAGGEEEE